MLAKSLLAEGDAQELRLFYSYARTDLAQRETIDRALARYKWAVLVRPWYDGEIAAGEPFDTAIHQQLEQADIVLLFVTNSFMRSEYCQTVELPLALERHRSGTARLIPIILEETDPDWRSSAFGALQALPRDGRAVTLWPDQEAALADVAQGVVDIIVKDGLSPDNLRRWELHLEGSLAEFDGDARSRTVIALRDAASDRLIHSISLRQGSIVMTMESSREALNGVRESRASGRLDRLDGRRVLDLHELYGAGIHASVELSGPSHWRPGKLPDPALMLLPSDPFDPVRLNGLVFDDDRFRPQFLFHVGDTNRQAKSYAGEHAKCIEYFLASVAIPDSDQYVNLAPDESLRMLSPSMSGTRMGRDLLDQDYKLKRLASSLLHPETESGRLFWSKVAGSAKGAPLDMFQRVWIVPDQTFVYEGTWESLQRALKGEDGGKTSRTPDGDPKEAYILRSHLKVMCEHEYLAAHALAARTGAASVDAETSAVFKEVILPIIEKDVNEGSTFAPIRQIYSGMCLATWLKARVDIFPQWRRYIDTGNPSQLDATTVAITKFNAGTVATNPKVSPLRTAESQSRQPPGSIDEAGDALLARGTALREHGDLDRSQAVLRRLYEARVHAYGKGNARTISVALELGATLRELGSLTDAVELHQEAFETGRSALGDYHEDTLRSMEALAESLLRAGQAARARSLQAAARINRFQAESNFKIPENRDYFEKYMDVFSNGVFYLERQEYDTVKHMKVMRVYFSGALDFRWRPVCIRRAPTLDTSDSSALK